MRLLYAENVDKLVEFYNENKKDNKVYTIQKLTTFYLSEEYFDDEIKRFMEDNPEIDEEDYDYEYMDANMEIYGSGDYHDSAPVDEESTFYELYEYSDMDELNKNISGDATPSANSVLMVEELDEGVYYGEDFDPLNARRWEVTVKTMETFINDNYKFNL